MSSRFYFLEGSASAGMAVLKIHFGRGVSLLRFIHREKFIEKYYPEKQFVFFSSVFNFITGGSVFQFKELIFELKTFYHIEDSEIPVHYETINTLGYPNVFSLSEKEYRKATQQMLIFSDKGLYNIKEYLTIFYFSSRFNNPLKFNLDKLEKRIILGMKKGKINYKFQDSLDFYLQVDENSKHKERLLRIKEATLEINKEIHEIYQKSKCKQLEGKCYDNFQIFSEEVLKPNNQYAFTPIFRNFSAQKFYLFFLRSNGKTKWEVVNFWRSRLRNYSYSGLKQEINFLDALKDKLEKKLNSLPKSGINNFIFTEHIKVLKKAIQILNETT